MRASHRTLRSMAITESQTQRFALTCSMQLSDGRRVSGRIETDSPIRDASVRYSGAVHLLPFKCQAANSLVLRALFRSFAGDLKAQYQELMVERIRKPRRALKPARR
jgi:hypothetical protein